MTAPSGIRAAIEIAVMSLRLNTGAKIVWVLVGLLSLPMLGSGLSLATESAGLSFFKEVLSAYLRFFVPFIMALFASSAVAEEVQDKTITYLFSRPIRRWSLPAGKYLGGLALASPLVALSITGVYLICMLEAPSLIPDELPTLARGLLCVTLAAVYYGAMATAFGTIFTRYPFVATLTYFFVVELGLASVPGRFKVVSTAVHLQVLAGLYRPKTTLFTSDPEISFYSSLGVVLVMTLVWLVLSVAWVQNAEYRTDQ